jgi:hypothetical protein
MFIKIFGEAGKNGVEVYRECFFLENILGTIANRQHFLYDKWSDK